MRLCNCFNTCRLQRMKTKLRYFNYSLCKSKCFCRRYFFFVLIWRDKKAFQFSEFQHRYKLLFRKTHVHFSTPLFNPTNFAEKKTNIEWIICGAIQKPIFLFCSNHVSHCEWNAFQSAYTFSFFSLCSLSKIKLKLIHSVRCTWMW